MPGICAIKQSMNRAGGLKVCPHLNWIRTGLQTELIDANRNRIQCAFIASTLLVVLLTKRFQHACLHMIVTRIPTQDGGTANCTSCAVLSMDGSQAHSLIRVPY